MQTLFGGPGILNELSLEKTEMEQQSCLIMRVELE